MSKRNGRQGPDGYDPHHHPGHHRGGLLPQLTPANVIGMALFLFFTSQARASCCSCLGAPSVPTL